MVRCSLMPGERKVKRKPLKTLCINGSFSENRDDWKKLLKEALQGSLCGRGGDDRGEDKEKCQVYEERDAEPKKRIKSQRAIALTLVMSKWCAVCAILRLEKVPEELKQVHAGGVDGISCQHVLVTCCRNIG